VQQISHITEEVTVEDDAKLVQYAKHLPSLVYSQHWPFVSSGALNSVLLVCSTGCSNH
jgi:hypothetical protein